MADNIIEQSTHSPTKGSTYSYSKVAAKATLDTLKEDLLAQGYEVTSFKNLQQDGLWEITWQVGDEDKSEDTWEINENEVNKDLLHSDFPSVLILTQTNVSILDHAIRNVPSLKDSNWEPLPDPSTLSDTQVEHFYKVWNLLRVGVRTIKVKCCSLKKTFLCSNQYDFDASSMNVDVPYSNETLIAVENVPMENWNTMFNIYPTGLFSDIRPAEYNKAIANSLSKSLTLQYGWLKHAPKKNISGWNKIQISQEWEYGLYFSEVNGSLL